ncbi:phosphotransferase [Kribbella sp. NPDC056951]|uniref:phosphotransferase n=1 Tax=Kribbella sp. NPDC056951 TaxID=3345978 RepID=UPI0036262961
METVDIERATAATKAITSAEDSILLSNSNKIVLRLLPGDVLARVAFDGEHGFPQELELARRLLESGSPVVAPTDLTVHERDGFAITLWRYYEPLQEIPPAEYAAALQRLHVGMREIDVPAPHFMDRVREAEAILSDRVVSPDAPEADRELLLATLAERGQAISTSGAREQLLHGEPHPGNLLSTKDGPLFIDLETYCRGPVEFDLAHAPDEIAEHYPGIDRQVLDDCRLLMLAMVTAWRWDRNDQLPNGRQRAEEWIAQIRSAA